MSHGGLFQARQLRRHWPDAKIYGVGKAGDAGRSSRVLDHFFVAETAGEIDAVIRKIAGREDAVCAYLCSNPMLETAVFVHPEWFSLLSFENAPDVYRRLVDKAEMAALCRECGVPFPAEYPLDELSAITFPAVVKPATKERTLGASKCAVFSDVPSLVSYLDKLESKGVRRDDLYCQQAVAGDNRWEYGYGGFFADGVPVLDICFHQFRQQPQGLCCYVREMTDTVLAARLRAMVSPILEKTRYSGFLEFDVKQDSRTGDLYLLDVNPRPWRSVDMLLPKLGDSSVFQPILHDVKVVWRYPYRELLGRKNKLNPSYRACRKLAHGPMKTQWALYDPMDRRPFASQARMDWKDYSGRIKKHFCK